MMFRINCLLDISDGKPGMMIPIFSSSTTNLPYVQQMDEFFEVRQIVPFLDYEHYPSHPSERDVTISVGEPGIIAFRLPDGSLFVGDVGDATALIADLRELIYSDPLLRIQLDRIESAELPTSYNNWRRVAETVFEANDQRKLWIDCEHRIFQKQIQIWDAIDIDVSEDDSVDQTELRELVSHGDEYLIHWLAKRKNYNSKNWPALWRQISERMPFDERVINIGIDWLYAASDLDFDFSVSKFVIFTCIGYYPEYSVDWREFALFISDKITSDPSLIFDLVRPTRALSSLLLFLSVEGDIDETLGIVDYCIENVPKDARITEAMVFALLQILAGFPNAGGDNATSKIVNDFQRSRAASILDRLTPPE